MADGAQHGRLGDLAEDATGFGATEWRTGRDLLLRPAAVLDAYLMGGPTGGGLYARPTRFYLALCGVLMFYLILIGGTQRMIEGMPADLLARSIAASGKTREAFVNDADGWLTLTITPVLALLYALALAPVIKRWGGTGWRLAFRATFALLCAWTVPFLPFGPLPFLSERFALATNLGINALLVLAFVRMGRGRWWSGAWQATWRSVVIVVLITLAGAIGMIPVTAIGALGGIYGN